MDVFAIDFAEEWSAFSGEYIHHQSQYINDCVQAILTLYQDSAENQHPAPQSVFVLAHSMGGIATLWALLQSNYRKDSMNTIVTLSTPYQKSPYVYDAEIHAIYNELGQNPERMDTISNNTVVVSLAGGFQDQTIHSSLTNLRGIIRSSHGFSSLTSALPFVNVSMDHLTLLWCHPLLDRIAHSIVNFDAHASAQDRLQSLRDHLATGHDAVEWNERENEQSLARGYTLDEREQVVISLMQPILTRVRVDILSLISFLYVIVLWSFAAQVDHWQNQFSTAEYRTTSPVVVLPRLDFFFSPQAHFACIPTLVSSLVAWMLPEDEKALLFSPHSSQSKSSSQSGWTIVGMLVMTCLMTVWMSPVFDESSDIMSTILSALVLYSLGIGLLSSVFALLHGLGQCCRMVRRRLGQGVFYFCLGKHVIHPAFVVTFVILLSILGGRYVSASSISMMMMMMMMDAGLPLVFLSVVLILYGVVPVLGTFVAGSVLDDRIARKQALEQYRKSLYCILFLTCPCYVGPVLHALDILIIKSSPGSSLIESFESSLWWPLMTTLLPMSLMLLVVLTPRHMLPYPPLATFAELDGFDTAWCLYQNKKSRVLPEDCVACSTFEDAGPGAEFHEEQSRDGKDVWYRVISCDCLTRASNSKLGEVCDYCSRSCRMCGGGQAQEQTLCRFYHYFDTVRGLITFQRIFPMIIRGVACYVARFALSREYSLVMATNALALVLLLYHFLCSTPLDLHFPTTQGGKEHQGLEPLMKEVK